MKEQELSRREFTLESVLALLGGVTITITGCGGGGGSSYGMSSSNPTNSSGTGDMAGSISDNHGHSAMIVAAQLTAGNGVALSIRGSADHTHTVELTAAEINRIKSNQTVAKDSTRDATTMADHLHTVTFGPGAGPVGPGY